MKSASESEIIARLATIAGLGSLCLLDDAACITPPQGCDLVVSADAFNEGIHFFSEDTPQTIARRAFRATLSDLAAKGAAPLGFTLTLGLPGSCTMLWIDAFVETLHEDIELYGCPLLGGDTTRTHHGLTLSFVVLGSVPQGRMVLRSGAKPGDHIVLTGSVGDAALGLALRRFQCGESSHPEWSKILDPRSQDILLQRFLCPHPRLECVPFLRNYMHASQDVSDGLLGDLKHLLSTSGVDGVIHLGDLPFSPSAHQVLKSDPRMLRTLLTGGDDYEILGTLAPDRWEGFKEECRAVGLHVTSIGRVAERGRGWLHIENGNESPFLWNPSWNEGPLSYAHD